MAKNYDDTDGVWRTIGGRRVFIRTGQNLSDAMKESGKFKLSKKQKEAEERLNKKAKDGAIDDIKEYLNGNNEDWENDNDFIKDLANEWGLENDEAKKIFIEELRNKYDNEQNIFKKGEISEKIHMLQDDFKGTKEEYRKYVEKEQERRLSEHLKEKEIRLKEARSQELNRSIKNVKTQKGLKEMADNNFAKDITRLNDEETKALRKKHGHLETVKVIKGTYGMNGALLKSRETGEYFVITARNSNLFYWV